jgi:hypothetical protein
MVAAAVGIGAAVAGIGGSLISADASKSAANTQAAAARNASDAAMAQFNQTQENLAPYQNAGRTALDALTTTLGLPGGNGLNMLQANGINGLTFQPTQAQLEATPGYQFNLNQGLQGVAASNAAAGRGISGPALKGAAAFATGLANNTLGTQQGIFQQNLQNVLGPLQGLTQTGQNSSALVGQQGLQAVGNSNALQVGAANAQASGAVGSANALAGGLGAVGGAPLNYLLYSQLLNGSGSTSSGTLGADY